MIKSPISDIMFAIQMSGTQPFIFQTREDAYSAIHAVISAFIPNFLKVILTGLLIWCDDLNWLMF